MSLLPGPGDTAQTEDLNSVTIKSVQKRETISSTINLQKKSVVIMDVVSSESIKKTPDRTISDVLKRVGGTSIQNDKFVVIRGLSDRYNTVLVNNSIIGSTEPDRKSFSFDMVPSNSIDNLIIYKTASADLPGDFSGGIIKLTTKSTDIKTKSFDLGLSYGSLSSARNSYFISTTKLPKNFLTTREFRGLGFEQRKKESEKIYKGFNPKIGLNIPNQSFAFNYGKIINKTSVYSNLTFRRSNNITTTERRDYMTANDLMYSYNDKSYNQLQNLGIILNVKHKKTEFKNIFNNLNENTIIYRNGVNYDNQQFVTSNSSVHNRKTILLTQIIKPKYSLNYSLMIRNQPDYRVNPYAKNMDYKGDSSFIWRDSYRFWSKMNEHTFGGLYNDSFRFVKFGFYEQFKIRHFSARVFRYEPDFVLSEITNNTDKYLANSNLFATYLITNKKIGRLINSLGVRFENQLFNVNTFDFSGREKKIKRNYLDILPSYNLKYDLNKKQNIRLSISKTVARPEFREVSNFSYYDFIRNAQIIGNPDLIRTKITNMDLRYEIFPSSKEIITISTFYKNFTNPIEQVVDNGSVPSNLILTLSNAKEVRLFGMEMEVRKTLNKNLTIYSNLSYFNSKVNMMERTRALQGQSPYIINSGLFYTKNNFSFNLLYNRIGERISAVGFDGYPDIYENARDVVDLTIQYQKNNTTIKMGISDLLSQNSYFYQTNHNRKLINSNNEKIINLTINHKL